MSEPFKTFFKEPLGTHVRQRRARRAAVVSAEKANKLKVRARDHGCRWPGCECRGLRLTTEVSHIDDKGMGGDHALRSGTDNMVELCVERHRGTTSLHSGDLRIDKLTDRGADGPLAFYRKNAESGEWVHLWTDRTIGVSETHGR